MLVSVILPTHNPHAGRLARALAGLAAQSLPAADWETIVVDNASTPPLDADALPAPRPGNLRVVREPEPGLTPARRRGLTEARGTLVVFVDDDNVLAPDYLAEVVRLFSAHPRLGAAGGPSRPEFEAPVPDWAREFFPLLALRERGAKPEIAAPERAPDGRLLYPPCAPIGAGMALRREAVQPWLDRAASLPDRRGAELSSAGDNDIVLTLLAAGWAVGYFPALALTHLIPPSRLAPDYLARLNRGIQTSWMQVLTKHGANPWPPIARWTVPLRQTKAWFAHRAWSGPVARIRWQGASGHFSGRTDGVR